MPRIPAQQGDEKCSIVFCKKRAVRREYCHRHHYRIKRYKYPFTRRELFAIDNPPKDGVGKIPLTRGFVALVDADLYDFLMQWCWSTSDKGYAFRTEKRGGVKRNVYMHRVVANTPKGLEPDHWNHDIRDNRRENLRNSNHSKNQQNGLAHRDSSSRFKGVCWVKKQGSWRASIGYEGEKIYIGSYATQEEAARAYDKRALELFGPDARLNCPTTGGIL